MQNQVMEFDVLNMTCGHCAGAVTKAIKAEDPEAKVTVLLAEKRVTVETTEQREDIAASIVAAGYPVV